MGQQNSQTVSSIDLAEITSSIKKELKHSESSSEPSDSMGASTPSEGFIYTGINGFDKLLKKGIPTGLNVLIEGNAGSGKTIFALQLLIHHASQGKKCLYISYEESAERLIQHMKDFGWDPDPLIKKGSLIIKRYLTSDIYYEEDQNHEGGVQAMMARDSDHMMLDLEPFIIGSDGFNPDITVIDSLTAISSTFLGKDRHYRFYLERLFRFLENLDCTTFLITEPTSNMLGSQMQTSCERFLADGIIALYNARRGAIREHGVEILKLRGASHEKKIAALKITNEGIQVFPEQEVFGDVDS
jgi:circadian clock protein KaiC